MRFVWFTWKDREHPLAGGAEVVNEELAKRLVKDGHEVHFIVGGFKGGVAELMRDGFKITRVGGRVSVYWAAYKYYKQHLMGWAYHVIDEINTIPFFSSFYCKEPVTLFIHQLAREIWFYEMVWPLSWIGFCLEPLYLRALNRLPVITISESTKKDLLRYGFSSEKIQIISEGIEMKPLSDIDSIQKNEQLTMLAFGSLRAMKRTKDIIRAFEIAKKSLPNLKLVVAGGASDTYGREVQWMMEYSRFHQDIEYLGAVSPEKKIELMQKCHILCVTSVKEGWGLVVTEAASQGTPSIVYNVDGLRDSVRDQETGLICQKNNPTAMAEEIVVLLQDQSKYEKLRRSGWEWSKGITFEKGYEEFLSKF